MAKQDIFTQIIKAVERGVESGLRTTGSTSVVLLKYAEEDSNVTGRLRDSFSYATSKYQSQVGGEAQPGDAVDKPNVPFEVHIGTKVPYASQVNYGSVNNFQYGMNGNPANFEALVNALENWIYIKSIQPRGDISVEQLARYMAKNIEEFGTDAHPFWDMVIAEMKPQIPFHLKDGIEAELRKVQGDTTTIESKDPKAKKPK